MPASRDAVDDVLAAPHLEGTAVEVLPRHGQVDGAVDVTHLMPGDARRTTKGRVQPSVQLTEGLGQATTDPPGEDTGAVEEGGDDRKAPVVGHVELDVVDVAAQQPGAVDELVVQQLAAGIELASGGHAPALVAIMSGIAATATTQMMTM
jgi:hypothetical protein